MSLGMLTMIACIALHRVVLQERLYTTCHLPVALAGCASSHSLATLSSLPDRHTPLAKPVQHDKISMPVYIL